MEYFTAQEDSIDTIRGDHHELIVKMVLEMSRMLKNYADLLQHEGKHKTDVALGSYLNEIQEWQSFIKKLELITQSRVVKE